MTPSKPAENRNLTLQVMLLAWPIVLQSLSNTLLGVTDTWFVSRISTDAIAAAGLGSLIFFTALTFFRGTANSTIAFVGRAHGEGDTAKVGRAVWRSLNMVAWLSLIVLVLPFVFSFVMKYAAPPDNETVIVLGQRYLQIRAFEIPFMLFTTVVSGFLFGRGDSRTPMLLAWVLVLSNIFLDWLLVPGNLGFPMLGVPGAAWASLMANGIAATVAGLILWNRQNREIYKTHIPLRATLNELRAALTLGLPQGLGDMIEIASFGVFFAMIGRLGTDILAANQIALQYLSIAFTFGIAINIAASSLVAQYLGAGDGDSAEKIGWRAVMLAVIGMVAIGLSYLIAPERLMGFFSTDERVIAAGVTVLRVMAVHQVFDAIGIALSGALNGAGDTRFTMLGRLVLAWGLFVPLTWAIIFKWNGNSAHAWMGAMLYLSMLAGLYAWRFRSGRWKTIQLE